MFHDDGTITLDIRTYLDTGLDVYDAEKTKVGTILTVDRGTGYMTIRPHPLSNELLYVPVSAITHIDAREVFLSQSTDQLQHTYADPPPRETMVKKRTDPDTGQDESVAVTREPSGYDGAPVVVEVANIGELAHHIAPGFRVYDSEMKDIGRIKEFDREAGKLVVEQGFPVQDEIVVPLAVVDEVNREERTIHLAVSSADLERPVAVRSLEETAEVDTMAGEEIVAEEITNL